MFSSSNQGPKTLYIKPLPPFITSEVQLQEEFQLLGQVRYARIDRDQQPIVGYVEFARTDIAAGILSEIPVGQYQIGWAVGNLSDNQQGGACFNLRHRETPRDTPVVYRPPGQGSAQAAQFP